MKRPLKRDIIALAKKYHLRLLVLFGSQASGHIHKESDLDLAFYALTRVNEERLYTDLIHLFKRADLDLINIATTHNHILRYHILSTGETLYEAKKGLKSKMEWQSYFDYMDFQHYYTMRSALLDKKIAQMVAHG